MKDNSKYIIETLQDIKCLCNAALDFIQEFNQCAYTDRFLESIVNKANTLNSLYESQFPEEDVKNVKRTPKIGSWFKIKCGWNRPGEYTYAQLVDIKTYKGKTQYVWSSVDGFQFVSYDLKDTTRVTRKEVIK